MGAIIKPVTWTNRATRDLEKVTKFNLKLYGVEKALEISTNLIKSTEILDYNNELKPETTKTFDKMALLLNMI